MNTHLLTIMISLDYALYIVEYGCLLLYSMGFEHFEMVAAGESGGMAIRSDSRAV